MRSPVFPIIGLAYAVIGVVFAWPKFQAPNPNALPTSN